MPKSPYLEGFSAMTQEEIVDAIFSGTPEPDLPRAPRTWKNIPAARKSGGSKKKRRKSSGKKA